MSTSAPKRVYRLREGVRVFSTNGDEIRFRKGIWNFTEAALQLAGQDERPVRFLRAVAHELIQEGTVDANEIAVAQGLQGPELEELIEIFEALRQQQYLSLGIDSSSTDTVSALFGGNLSGFEPYVGTTRPVVFFADNDYAKNAATTIAKEIQLPLDVFDKDVLSKLAQVDLTTKIEPLEQACLVEEFQRYVGTYCCVLGCVASPNIAMLRNLNRVLIKAEKPLILGLVDGPFASVLSVLPHQSGCFECYEQRLLARLEDSLAYHQFVRSTTNPGKSVGFGLASAYAPGLHVLTGTVISEGFLYANLSVLRLAGRALSVYLPLLEVQVQDLLRVPYCPACGFIATAEMKEMYTSSRRVISDMLARVSIRRSES